MFSHFWRNKYGIKKKSKMGGGLKFKKINANNEKNVNYVHVKSRFPYAILVNQIYAIKLYKNIKITPSLITSIHTNTCFKYNLINTPTHFHVETSTPKTSLRKPNQRKNHRPTTDPSSKITHTLSTQKGPQSAQLCGLMWRR